MKRSFVTLRSLSTTLIEVAIDEGDISAADGTASQPISELELEPQSGEPAALYDAVVRIQSFSFAADATVETVLQEVGRASLLHVVRNEPAAMADVPEAVHQMRVAIRRLRSALAGIKPMLSSEHYAWANGDLKSLATVLDAPRDWDAFAEQLLRPVIDALPEEEGLTRLARVVERERHAAHQKARKAICSSPSAATILGLSRWFEARAWRDQPVTEQSAQLRWPIINVARALLGRRLRQAKKRSEKFKSLEAADRHRLRVAIKKLRYTIEFLECLFDRDEVEGYVGSLKSLQDDLGYVNDLRVSHALLARLHNGSDDNRLGQAGGIVLGWHDRRLFDQERELRKQVRRFRRTEPFW